MYVDIFNIHALVIRIMASETPMNVLRNNPRLISSLFFMLLLVVGTGQVAAVVSSISGP